MRLWLVSILFFFNDTATTEIYTLSLHDALPIFYGCMHPVAVKRLVQHDLYSPLTSFEHLPKSVDRKSTRLNSSHGYISYAVFCLKKKRHHARPGTAVPHSSPGGSGEGTWKTSGA